MKMTGAYDFDKVIQNITELQLKIKDKLLSVGDEEYAVMLRGQLRGIAEKVMKLIMMITNIARSADKK